MLAELGSLRSALARDYQKALNDILRPADAAPGAVHQAVARLHVPAILTTNYPYRDHAELPAILEELPRAAASLGSH